MKQISYTKAKSILQKHNIYVDGYKWLLLARQIAKEDGCLISSKWFSRYEYKNNYDSPDIQKETTYADCVSGLLSANGNGIFLEITIHDGNNFDGRREGLRCSFKLSIQGKLPKEVSEAINWTLDGLAKDVIRKEDDEIYRERVSLAKKNLLNSFK